MRNLTAARRRKAFIVVTVLFMAVVTLFIIDIQAGFTKLSLSDFLSVIQGTATKTVKLTLVNFRLPRVIIALLVGLGLSVSGAVLQGITRNELADPGILGINAGAGLMVAAFMTVSAQGLHQSAIGIPLAAFVGAIITALLVFALSYVKRDGIHPSRLILTGVSLTVAINAVTILLLLRMKQSEYGFIAGWISGNLWGISWYNIRIMVPCILLLLCFVLYKSRTLDVLSLGSQLSTGLGVAVNKQSLLLLIASAGLAGICVAVGGGISFIGLICPHVARSLVGPKHRMLIPTAALMGATLLLLSDIIARTIIAPNEISIGIVATIIGAPYFIYVLTANKRTV